MSNQLPPPMIEETPENPTQQQVTESSLKLKATEGVGEIQNKPEQLGETTPIGQGDAIQIKASNNLKILQRKIKAESQAFRFIFEVNQQSKNRLKPHELAALTVEERLEQTIITLSKQPDRRSLLDHKLIEETLDQFAYIQKMRKYNSNLSKQVAKVLEHNKTPKGRAVFFAGQQPEYFYMILRGKVAVLVRKSENQMTSDKKSGKVMFFPSNQSLGSPSNNSVWRKNSSAVECPNLVLQHQQQSDKHTLSHFAALLNAPNNQEFSGQQTAEQQSLNVPAHEGLRSIVNEGTSASPTADSANNTPDNSSNMKGQRSDLTISVNRSRLVSKALTPKQDNSANNSRQSECICQGIDLTPADLDEAYKFFENGVFAYNYVKDLTPGSAFGEMGLLLRVPRTATILALEDTDLAVMTKQGYQDLIKAIENFKLQKKIQFFHSVMHQDLKAHELTRITIDFSQKKKFMKGQHIFQEGDSADEVYIIKKGDVEFYKAITSEGKTKKAQFSLIGPGEIVGVEELFYGQDERYYSAFCQNTVTAYFIQRVIFIRLMHEIPDLKRIMVKRSVNKLKWQQFKITEVVEQQKLDGLFDKNAQIDLHMPQTDQLCEPVYEKIKKRSKSSHVSSSTTDQNNKNDGNNSKQISQSQWKKPSILVNNNKVNLHQSQNTNASPSQVQLPDDSEQSKISKISNSRSAQDLMIGFAKKKFIAKESMQQQEQQQQQTASSYYFYSSSISPSKALKTGNSIDEDRIGDAIKNKEKIMQMIERRSTNITEDFSGSVKSPSNIQSQSFAAASSTAIPSQSNRPSYLLADTPSNNRGNTWFDLDKKKELEAQIEHAIKQKRTTLKPSHHKIKQKSHDCLIVAADNKHSADISILPAAMRKKLLFLNQQRESSQLTEYTNSPADDEIYSPLSPLKGSSRNMLSFSVQAIQDQAASQIYFTNSLKSAQAVSNNEILPQLLPSGAASVNHINNKQNVLNNADHCSNQYSINHLSNNNISCASPTKHPSRLNTAFEHSNSFSLLAGAAGNWHSSESPKKGVSSFQFLINSNAATEVSPRRQSQPQLGGGQSFSSSNFHIRRMVPHGDSDHKHLTANNNTAASQKQQTTNPNPESYFNQAIPSLSDIDKYAGNEYQQQMSEVCFSPMSSTSQRRRFTKTVPLRIGTAKTPSNCNNNFQLNNGLNTISGNENGMSISQLIPTRSTRPSEMLRGSDIFIPSGINSKQSITFSQTSKSLILPASLSPKKLHKAAGQQSQHLQIQSRNGSIAMPQSTSNSQSQFDSPVSRIGFPASFSLETTGGLYFPATTVSRKQQLNTENKQTSPQMKTAIQNNTDSNGFSPQNSNSSLRISVNANESAAARSSLLKLVKS